MSILSDFLDVNKPSPPKRASARQPRLTLEDQRSAQHIDARMALMRSAHASLQDGQALVITARRDIRSEPNGARVTHVVTYRTTDRQKATKESTHARLEKRAA